MERKHLKIEDLQKDFATGVNLINFLEVLVNKNVKNRYVINVTFLWHPIVAARVHIEPHP